MPTPIFDFFEVIADELSATPSRVITREDLRVNAVNSPLLDTLKEELKVSSTEEAIKNAVDELKTHFEGKGSVLPFSYDSVTGRFTETNRQFLMFVKEMSGIRSLGKHSKEFEIRAAECLRQRATGTIHRVGHPRDSRKRKTEFNEYLSTLGFKNDVLLGKDKDGGLDILWMLPIGTIPHRPIVSVQCKNAEFDMDEADLSVAAARRSFGQHGRLQPTVHVPCVLFNDYLFPARFTIKQLDFIPLGLTDLAPYDQQTTFESI